MARNRRVSFLHDIFSGCIVINNGFSTGEDPLRFFCRRCSCPDVDVFGIDTWCEALVVSFLCLLGDGCVPTPLVQDFQRPVGPALLALGVVAACLLQKGR